MRWLVVVLIKGYQYLLSPFLVNRCRFYPSCSEYAHQAVIRHGVFRGGVLVFKRLCRCHPWGGGGIDEVP